jgi:hypothetical protein
MRLTMRWMIAAVSAAALVAVWVAPNTAQATKHCARAEGKRYSASVEVMKGHVSCKEARRVAAAVFSGRARYHDHGCGSPTKPPPCNSYFTVRSGWRGNYSTGGWRMTNRRRGAVIGGGYTLR